MDVITGPDGRPATFDGAAWISADRMYWWNGGAWEPLKRRRGFRPNWFVIGMALLLVAAGVIFVSKVQYDAAHPPVVPLGVTNAKIDSPSQVEFDYAQKTACNGLTFKGVFYDKNGKTVQVFDASSVTHVPANQVVHMTFHVTPPLPATAVRFDAIPTCHD